MIKFNHVGDFSKLTKFLKNIDNTINYEILKKYGEQGVAHLSSATPKDTGKTADSWYYSITRSKGTIKLSFFNTNIQNGLPIAIILQYGHGTRNGGWVQGIDYINPAIQPVFEKLANDVWKEVTSL